jgi:hypothetical protein
MAIITLTFRHSKIEPWTEPINLSRTGSTTIPVMFVDAKGNIHAIWVDEFDGFVYTHWNGNRWNLPALASFPFTEFVPILLADNTQTIHAFLDRG